MGPLRPQLADGGLATHLQSRGLPPMTPVHDFLRHHPERVLQAHCDFVEAGAELLLAGTFQALPTVEEDWRELQAIAVSLAREAAGASEVWGSIGPGPRPTGAEGTASHRSATADWQVAADALAPRVDGIVLETFTDLRSGLAALEAVGDQPVPVVLTWSPDLTGDLYDGTPPGEAVARALEAGASATGFNCGADPTHVVAALGRCEQTGLWAKPSGVPGDPEAVARALQPLLDRCAVVGGCCGAGPEAIRALGAIR